MIRFVLRVLGLLLVAAGFVGLVIDGTQFIANGSLVFTTLGEVGFALFPRQFPLLEPALTLHVHPFLWDPVALRLLLLPAALVGFVLGFLLLWLGRKPPEKIGYIAET